MAGEMYRAATAGHAVMFYTVPRVRDLTHPKLLYFKAGLFLLSGLLAAAALVLEHPEFRTILLLSLAIWCFARCYYFAFYVIQHYIDPSYRFSGLWSFLAYCWRRRPS